MTDTQAEKFITDLLASADIKIGGERPWDIKVYNQEFFKRCLVDGSLGAGEAYMLNWWECQSLDQLTVKALEAKLPRRIENPTKLALETLLAKLYNRQNRSRSYQVARKHYDLDADFFMSILDPYNQYTCGYFKDTDNLNLAQEKKLDLQCRKLNLQAGDKVLDIGCGWGGFAKFAASQYGCHVTGISISDSQIEYARKFCNTLPVEIKKCHYQDIQGKYDKILICGMIEHVGSKNYRKLFEIVHQHLNNNGIFLLHTIGGNRRQATGNRWLNKYIFPNYTIPAISEIGAAAEALFAIEDWHNFGPYYDNTLMAWNSNFEAAWPKLKEKYDDQFKRMWHYYLLGCAGYFRARHSQLWQIVMTKIGRNQPNSRLS